MRPERDFLTSSVTPDTHSTQQSAGAMLVCCDRVHHLNGPLECFMCKRYGYTCANGSDNSSDKQNGAPEVDELSYTLSAMALSALSKLKTPACMEVGVGKHSIVVLSDPNTEVILFMRCIQDATLPYDYCISKSLASFGDEDKLPFDNGDRTSMRKYLGAKVGMLASLLLVSVDLIECDTINLSPEAVEQKWTSKLNVNGEVVFVHKHKKLQVPSPTSAKQEIMQALCLDADKAKIDILRVGTNEEFEKQALWFDYTRRKQAKTNEWL